MMARNFKELRAKMSPAARAKSEALAREDIAHMAPDELLPETVAEEDTIALNNDPPHEVAN